MKSGFYGAPKDPSDPPPSLKPSERSRAIDIFAILNPSAPPRISYRSVSGGLTTFLQLEIAVKLKLLHAHEVWHFVFTTHVNYTHSSDIFRLNPKLVRNSSLWTVYSLSCSPQRVMGVNIYSYENNWLSARHLLCRKYVKDIASNHTGDCDEDPALRNFERFLSKASERNDLGFISKGVSASGGHWLASDGVLQPFMA